MERPPRLKKAGKKSYFPKAATFSIPQPSSPGSRSEKGFSGPINVSIIPREARHKKRSDSSGGEPVSPKISCMGQIKQKKKAAATAKRQKEEAPKKPGRRLFVCCCMLRQDMERQQEEAEVEEKKEMRRQPAAVAPAPGLGQMRRYTSARETLAGFDWRNAMEGNSDDKGTGEEEEVLVPYSAPILVGGGEVAVEPRKEVNIWRRRAMAPPIPLQAVRK